MNRLALCVVLGLSASAVASTAAPGAGWAADATGAGGGGIFGDLMPLAPGDLAALASGAGSGPVVLSRAESSGGGSAVNTAAIGKDGRVAIRSHAQAHATIAGNPVVLAGNAGLMTGSFTGGVAMENSAGIATLQQATGLNNVQQSSVSFVFVLSGLPQP